MEGWSQERKTKTNPQENIKAQDDLFHNLKLNRLRVVGLVCPVLPWSESYIAKLYTLRKTRAFLVGTLRCH